MECTALRMRGSAVGCSSINMPAAPLVPCTRGSRVQCQPRQCDVNSQSPSLRPLMTFGALRTSRQQRGGSVVVTSVAGGASAVSGLDGAKSDDFKEKQKPVSKWNLQHQWRTWWDLQVCPNDALYPGSVSVHLYVLLLLSWHDGTQPTKRSTITIQFGRGYMRACLISPYCCVHCCLLASRSGVQSTTCRLIAYGNLE